MLSYLIESTACFLIFYLYYRLLLHNETCHQFKRYFLVISAILSVVFPILHLDFYSTNTSQFFILPGLVLDNNYQASMVTIFDPFNLIPFIYGAISALFLIRFALQLSKIFKAVRNGKSTKTESYHLVETRGKLVHSSFLRYIFWNSDSGSNSKNDRIILGHELAHVKGWHTLDLLFFELLKIVFWFNPAVHWYKNAAALNLEYLADQQSAPEDHTYYNSMLATNAIESLGFSMGSHFNKSFTLKRIKMLKRKKEKTHRLKLLATLPLFIASFIVVSCEPTLQESVDEPDDLKAINNEVFEKVDEMPMPVGGMQGFYNYVASNLKYSNKARKAGIEGKVFVQFVVTKDGKVKDVTVVKGIEAGCDQASIEVVEGFQKWSPGIKDGEKVNVQLTLPITFKLSE